MLKQWLLVGAAAFSVPAVAQDLSEVPPATEAPATEVPETVPEATSPQAPTSDQIAAVVESEFATYDSDADGQLSDSEFAAWMKKLRVASDPNMDPESQAVRDWASQAFAAADADQSASVSKDELTAFLSRGA
ncbi:EF-hand domain-containing protein [Sphingopyxis sp. MWB1]|uniref:EF-hand domain-containing protein n=1 Tax=Sphingopyxis sp. MWB1 TaxID=1537715 RepID=UPI0009DE7A96|nr:EF-hand domain-containing protein [Sphingopyxis sp. MWB1]